MEDVQSMFEIMEDISVFIIMKDALPDDVGEHSFVEFEFFEEFLRKEHLECDDLTLFNGVVKEVVVPVVVQIFEI